MHLRFTAAVLALACLHCGATAPPPLVPAPSASGASPAPVASASTAPPPPAATSAPAATPPAEEIHWSYTGAGSPDHWGDLKPDYAACKAGSSQTPVDLPSTAAKDASRKPPTFHYGPIPLAVLNNGHTIEVPNASAASMTVGDEKWDLAQFHFHAPSEHKVDGKGFDAELHLVHKNAKGELAVVGVLVKKGHENAVLKAVIDNAPGEAAAEPKAVAGATVDLKALVPARTSYFTYAGSLTTPPCTEGVTWFLAQTPIELSEAQIAKLHALMHGDNNRPVQPLGTRPVHRL
jgi:carbonic anhydrase